ncbi:hypothetical protein CMUS01_11089 [Colletotrichum musicola]|uniref:Uncharacterized protein n=1 Tax=Colletotrichum musicola TaxID=2175873 RepID=A0A8H6N6X5_9PEZI|nr:hypothetical protein CMUS01_11089 [Colletotrichum musicola]
MTAIPSKVSRKPTTPDDAMASGIYLLPRKHIQGAANPAASPPTNSNPRRGNHAASFVLTTIFLAGAIDVIPSPASDKLLRVEYSRTLDGFGGLRRTSSMSSSKDRGQFPSSVSSGPAAE